MGFSARRHWLGITFSSANLVGFWYVLYSSSRIRHWFLCDFSLCISSFYDYSWLGQKTLEFYIRCYIRNFANLKARGNLRNQQRSFISTLTWFGNPMIWLVLELVDTSVWLVCVSASWQMWNKTKTSQSSCKDLFVAKALLLLPFCN